MNSTRQTENEHRRAAGEARRVAGGRLRARDLVAFDLHFRRAAPPFCTRGDPVREDATGSSRFWGPIATAGHVGCIEVDAGRGTLTVHPLTTRSPGGILGSGFPRDFCALGHLAARPSRGWGEMGRRRMPWRSQMV